MIVEGTFMVSVATSEAQAFIGNSDVEDTFVASIAHRAGVLESTVQVTLSVGSSSGRRLTQTSDQVEILVTYAITAQEGASNDADAIGDSVVDNMVDTLTSTSAEDFVADFASEFQTTGSASSFSAVVAVPGSATAPTTTEATGTDAPEGGPGDPDTGLEPDVLQVSRSADLGASALLAIAAGVAAAVCC
jgi:hypothetical protein